MNAMKNLKTDSVPGLAHLLATVVLEKEMSDGALVVQEQGHGRSRVEPGLGTGTAVVDSRSRWTAFPGSIQPRKIANSGHSPPPWCPLKSGSKGKSERAGPLSPRPSTSVALSRPGPAMPALPGPLRAPRGLLLDRSNRFTQWIAARNAIGQNRFLFASLCLVVIEPFALSIVS